METHLEQYLYQPQKLLEDLRDADAQHFRTAMKCLLEDKWDHLVRRAWHLVRRGRAVGICWDYPGFGILDVFLSSLPPTLGTLEPSFFSSSFSKLHFLLFWALSVLRVF